MLSVLPEYRGIAEVGALIHTFPYRENFDKNGELWASTIHTDRVVRLNPKTGNMVQYLMPSDTNMRTVFVDNSTTPVTFWVGSNHDHRIVIFCCGTFAGASLACCLLAWSSDRATGRAALRSWRKSKAARAASPELRRSSFLI